MNRTFATIAMIAGLGLAAAACSNDPDIGLDPEPAVEGSDASEPGTPDSGEPPEAE